MKKYLYEDIEVIKISVYPFVNYMYVYLYYVDGFLIDTGPVIRKRKLMQIFHSLDIQQVALTHYHYDHTGMVRWLAKEKNCSVYAHPTTIRLLEKRHAERFIQPYSNPIKTSKYEWVPIHTPGHTSDHVCLYEPNKGWLFTGDLYVTPYPKVCLKEESISSYIESIKKLCELNVNTIFGGHEGIVHNGKAMLQKKLYYLQELQSEVIRLHQLGYKDKEIIRTVLPEKVRLELVTLGSFSRKNLIQSCYKN